MSGVEILSYLKKALGIIVKDLEEKGVVVSAPDHAFRPEVVVDDRGVGVDVGGGVVWKLKNLSNYPCYVNLDRPVSDSEYAVIPPNSFLVVARRADRVYLRAPLGHTCLVKVDALVS